MNKRQPNAMTSNIKPVNNTLHNKAVNGTLRTHFLIYGEDIKMNVQSGIIAKQVDKIKAFFFLLRIDLWFVEVCASPE